MRKYFGTDGVRGEYGKQLTDSLARELGFYGTKILTENHQPVIIIGMDTRESGKNLETALAQGILQAGGKVLSAGIIPTPAMAILVKELGADAAIMISASHNPYYDNGIKFFNNEGFKLADEIEEEIEKLIDQAEEPVPPIEVEIEKIEAPEKYYLDHIREVSPNEYLKEKKIVIDCANGANYKIAPEYFESLGPELIVIGNTPDGRNINQESGSTHLDHLIETVLKEEADFGLAFDGDADRLLAVDNEGKIIDGDEILYLFATDLKEKGELKNNTVVATTMSNIGLEEALRREGIKMIRQDVGDRYVLKEMLDNDYVLGGEQSGHIILLGKQTTGDGLLTASILSDILARSEKTASELNELVVTYPQVIFNAEVDDSVKYDFEKDEEILEKIRETEELFGELGRVNVRASGTQPLVRVMIEGKDKDQVETEAQKLKDLIETKLS